MADETKDALDSVFAVEVAPLEPKIEEPVLEEAKAEEPEVEKPTIDEYAGHKVSFNEAGECFIEKDGQCLGSAAGVINSAAEAKDFIARRAAEKSKSE